MFFLFSISIIIFKQNIWFNLPSANLTVLSTKCLNAKISSITAQANHSDISLCNCMVISLIIGEFKPVTANRKPVGSSDD